MNDTVYGPFYPFKIMFDEMDKRNLAFWGITKHGETLDPFGLTQDGIFPEHINSYFFAIDKKVLSCPEFKIYWDNLPDINTWEEAVSFHEVQFTKFLASEYKWDVYINTDKEFNEFSDSCLLELMAFELIKNYKMPIIKRKNFSTEYDSVIRSTGGDSTRKAYDYIKNHIKYDIDMIWENILRTARLKNIKDNLHLNYILPQGYVQDDTINIGDKRVALLVHLTYKDQIEFCAHYVCSIAQNASIYVTTSTEDLKTAIFEHFNKIDCANLKITVLPQIRNGRDVSALWVSLKPHIINYDYVCFIHDKKSMQDRPLTIGRGFAQRCLENTLASKEYVINILGIFQKNPRLGILCPPPVIHGPYRLYPPNRWGPNYKNTVELAGKLNINVPMDEQGLVFPCGGMFWFRPKALRKLVEHNWNYSDFPNEPLPLDGSLGHAIERIYCFAAQSEGYYSAWVMTDYFVSTELTSLNYLLAQTQRSCLATVQSNLRSYIKYKLHPYPRLLNFAHHLYRLMKNKRR